MILFHVLGNSTSIMAGTATYIATTTGIDVRNITTVKPIAFTYTMPAITRSTSKIKIRYLVHWESFLLIVYFLTIRRLIH
jgi:hypothetical protein